VLKPISISFEFGIKEIAFIFSNPNQHLANFNSIFLQMFCFYLNKPFQARSSIQNLQVFVKHVLVLIKIKGVLSLVLFLAKTNFPCAANLRSMETSLQIIFESVGKPQNPKKL
jgi:hypothetical protein